MTLFSVLALSRYLGCKDPEDKVSTKVVLIKHVQH
jgi:hypothetical protein